MIIGFSGRAGAGKSTAAEHFEGRGFTRDAYAKTMKEAVSIMFGIPLEILQADIVTKSQIDPYWGMTYRQILQLFGTEACRNVFGVDIWERILWRRYSDNSVPRDIVIDDVRFENEAEAIITRGGFVIEILRDGGITDSHTSENGLPKELIWASIENNGTKEELYFKLKVLYRSLN